MNTISDLHSSACTKKLHHRTDRKILQLARRSQQRLIAAATLAVQGMPQGATPGAAAAQRAVARLGGGGSRHGVLQLALHESEQLELVRQPRLQRAPERLRHRPRTCAPSSGRSLRPHPVSQLGGETFGIAVASPGVLQTVHCQHDEIRACIPACTSYRDLQCSIGLAYSV